MLSATEEQTLRKAKSLILELKPTGTQAAWHWSDFKKYRECDAVVSQINTILRHNEMQRHEAITNGKT